MYHYKKVFFLEKVKKVKLHFCELHCFFEKYFDFLSASIVWTTVSVIQFVHSGSGLSYFMELRYTPPGHLYVVLLGEFSFLKCRVISALPQWYQHIVNYIKIHNSLWCMGAISNTDDVVFVPSNETAKEMPGDSFD